MSEEITFAQVKKHKGSKNPWIVIHNDVYDVTSFLAEHPGGEDTLLEVAGKDGTQAFEDVGHSDDARQLMKKYKIGTLPVAEQTKFVDTCSHSPKCSGCTATSCPPVEKVKTEKSWRTYDGGPSISRHTLSGSQYKMPTEPKIEGRVPAIIVPRERRPRGPPCGGSKLKWALLALAGAIVIGIVLKKYMG